MKAGGGGARRNASLKQGVQVSMVTQRAATTGRHCHTEKLSGDSAEISEWRTEKLSGDTCQPLYSPRPATKERKSKGKLLHKCTICSSTLHDLPERVCII